MVWLDFTTLRMGQWMNLPMISVLLTRLHLVLNQTDFKWKINLDLAGSKGSIKLTKMSSILKKITSTWTKCHLKMTTRNQFQCINSTLRFTRLDEEQITRLPRTSSILAVMTNSFCEANRMNNLQDFCMYLKTFFRQSITKANTLTSTKEKGSQPRTRTRTRLTVL
jgi:hypothetical protein